MMQSVAPGARTLILQLLATSFMTGLIWFVQVVHYPLMEGWPHDNFGSWEVAHRERTGTVVIPPMLIEGVVAVWLLVHRPRGVHPLFPVFGMTALLGIWVSTFFLQVPCHLQLSTGWDAQTLRFLVNSNWIRTILWSFRMALSVGMVWQFWLAYKPALADLASLQQDS
jgi:hypothetical protein